MAASFLHGVETIVQDKGAKPIQIVKTSIIGLVGIAPKGSTNEIVVISNERQAVEVFGNQLPGFTIPQALASIFAQNAGRVLVVNVFDDEAHVAEVDAESKVITNGKTKTTYAPIGDIELTNSAGTTTYVKDTDFSIDAFGNITVLDFTSIAEGATVKATYNRLDAAEIADADFVGGTDPRSGFDVFDTAFSSLGYAPKILICPTYCEEAAVAAAMIAKATALRAVCIIDAPEGTAVQDAIEARGPGGDLAGFQSSSSRVLLTYPYLKAYDIASDAIDNRPFSPFMAGVIAATDQNEGYWVSASNKEILGITGVELLLTAALNDADSEVNQLNEVGLITVFNNFGTGFRTWGNRSAKFPSSSAIQSFYSVQRVEDILHESVELAMLNFIDKPINLALIDSIKASVNAFIRVLIGRGAIIDGECVFNPDNNPPEELAAGHLTFEISFVPPPPAERITFNSFIDINLLAALV